MSEEHENKSRVHIWVTGWVQGVGFRAHVEYCALQIGLTGWVRNVGMDMVETLAEGERAKLESFVEIVKRGPRGSRVDEARIEWEPVTGEFIGFSVGRNL